MGRHVSLSDEIQLPYNGPLVKNRLVKAAMVEGLSSILTGQPNELHYKLYKRWAKASFGMIISGNVCVANDHLGTPGDLRLPSELTSTTIHPWTILAQSMSHNSTISILQLVHTGRQSVRCAGRLPISKPLAPSPIRVSTNPTSYLAQLAERIAFQVPKEMDEKDIEHVIDQFVKGAKLAKKAGFNGIELHASHGYLLSSFLSPKTNKRKDRYGGSTEARLRIVIEIIERIREECDRPFVLGIKLNAADYLEGGLSEEEALRHVELLTRQGGLDFIEISGGSYESLAFLEADTTTSSQASKREAIFAAFASQAKSVALQAAHETGAKCKAPLIMCTGGFRSRVGIEQALNEDDIDLVGIGRPAAADPEWTERLLKSTSEGTSKNHADRCVAYSVTGGRWLEKLVPLKIVGGGMTTLWHELQMSRIARGEETKVAWSFERLLLVETCQAVSVRAIVSVVVLVLAWIMYRLA